MTDALFEKAVNYVRTAPANPNASNDEKLKLYALFKQGTVGDVQGSQPWAVQFEARAKWDAWKAQEGKSQELAKEEYISYLNEIHPGWNN